MQMEKHGLNTAEHHVEGRSAKHGSHRVSASKVIRRRAKGGGRRIQVPTIYDIMSRSVHGSSLGEATAIQYYQNMLDGNFMSCFYNITRSSRSRMSREASAMRRRKIWGTAPKC
jgi:hypothetical protein